MMNLLIKCLIVALGGALGSTSRYLLSLIPLKSQSGLPINTLFINIIGSFVIGLIVAISCKNKNFDSNLLLLIKVGICGGFTTFSTFSLETFNLLENRQYVLASIYIILSVTLCILSTAFAQSLIK